MGSRQFMRKIGPAWKAKDGRPPAGHFTRKTAEAALQAKLTDARRGTLPELALATSGATFKDASAEWLRYVQHDRKRRRSTVRDYQNAVSNTLDPEFGSMALDAITTDHIDRYRARLVADGKLSARTVNKYLVLLPASSRGLNGCTDLPRTPSQPSIDNH